MDHNRPMPHAGSPRHSDGAPPTVGREARPNPPCTASGRIIVRKTRRIRGFFAISGQTAKVEWLEFNR